MKMYPKFVALGVSALFSGVVLPSIAHAQAVTLGTGAAGTNFLDTAVGSNANAVETSGASGSTAIGAETQATGDSSGAFGAYSHATGNEATAVGATSTASGAQSTVAGAYSTASGAQSTVVGAYSTASGAQSTVIGAYATATGTNSVAIGYGSNDGGQANVVAFGGRRLIDLTNGIASTDAATMGQLSSMASALGGGAGYSSTTGAWTAPIFTVPTTSGSTSYSTVSAALAGIGARVTTLETTVASLSTSTSPSTSPSSSSSTTSSTTVSSSQAQQIVQQANTYTDQQMSGIGNQIGQLSNAVSSLGNQINSVDSMARAGIAADAALTRTAAMPYAPGHVVVMTGAATYRGQGAGAIGVGYWTADGRNSINFGAAYGGSNSGVYSAGYAHIF